MYRTNTRSAKRTGRRTHRMVFQIRGPRMHRDRIRAVVGATTSVIGTLLLAPWQDPPRSIDRGAGHGCPDADAELREGSP
jgi:hypothetical protein